MRAAALLLLAAVACGEELTDESCAKIRDQVVPCAEEMKWTEIPWRASFWDAVVEAQAKDLPVLLWAMNGHPLACT